MKSLCRSVCGARLIDRPDEPHRDRVTGMHRRTALLVAVAAALAFGLFAVPRRYVVDGVSMGPGLLPDDVVRSGWLPAFDHRRPPARFDRWIVTLPDGSTGLKRVVGLPGETISLAAGDLVVGDERILKGPRLLAEIGSQLGSAGVGGGSWATEPTLVLDDAPFAPGEVSRLMLPVRDAGFAAQVTIGGRGPVRVRATAGPLTVTWRLHAAGRYAVVAGRLDSHAVAAAWPLAAGDSAAAPGRHCLPAAAPPAWDVARPWPVETDPAEAAVSPALALDVLGGGDSPAVIDQVATWRDVHLRPAADGVTTWSLAAAEVPQVFVLGDFPSGSRDSRHFGPLDRADLRHRLPR